MVTPVNPPPHVPIPKEFQRTPGLFSWATQVGRILFQLWNAKNDNDNIIDNGELTTNTNNLAQLSALEQRLGSGDILTIDTTGFTVDTTKQFTDQVNA